MEDSGVEIWLPELEVYGHGSTLAQAQDDLLEAALDFVDAWQVSAGRRRSGAGRRLSAAGSRRYAPLRTRVAAPSAGQHAATAPAMPRSALPKLRFGPAGQHNQKVHHPPAGR